MLFNIFECLKPTATPPNSVMKKSGYTLFECLMVVMIIVIIAALAIPNMSSTATRVADTQDKALAQLIVATNQWGHIAGVEWEGKTKQEIIADMIKGRAPTSGQLKGKDFGISDHAEKALAPEVLDLIELTPDGQMSISK